MAKKLTVEKTMTMQEIADAMGVSKDTIRNCVRRVFPRKMQQGKTAYFNESEVAVISKELKNNNYVSEQLTSEAASQVKKSVTRTEIIANIAVALQQANMLVAELLAENKRLSVENESLEFALEYDKAKDCVNWGEWKKANHIKTSFSQIAKELNLEEGEDYFRQVIANGSRFPTIRVKESCLQSIFENYSAR